MKKFTVIVLGLAFTSISALAQWTYNTNYYTDAGNPGGLNTEADAPGLGTWTVEVTGPQGANIWSPAIAIPFAFNFYGLPVTQCYASQNGLVSFATNIAALPNANGNLPDATLPDSVICGFWDEFTATPPTGAGDDVRTNVFGTAPNRQFWIKWYSFEMGNPTNTFSYFAVVLEETTNKIYVVDQYSTTSTLTSTVGVQLDNSTSVQVGTNNTPLSSNGSANADNDYYEFTPVLLVNDDAGIASIDNPISPLSPGLQNIDVTFQNYGLNNLDTVTVEWEINGVPQTSYYWGSGPLIPGGTNGPVTLGSYNFPSGFTTIKAWTANPNATTDGNPLNDTVEVSLCSGLNGTYTVGGVGADFATMQEAADALSTCGVTGPVVLNVNPGTYLSSIVLNDILGTSSTNTIVFNGGSAATTTLTDDPAGAAPQAVISMQGGDYITFKNFTLTNSRTTDAWGVHFMTSSDHLTVDSCIVNMHMATGLVDVIAFCGSNDLNNDFTEGDNGDYCTFSNNIINGGEMAFHFEGPAAVGSWMKGVSIINNTAYDIEDYGVYMDNQDSVIISGNNFTSYTSNGNADGIYIFDIWNFDISKNTIAAPDYGIYIADGNFDAPIPAGRSIISNNMSKSNADYAIYLDDINNIDIFHNTAYGNPGIRINDFTGLDIRNNIFQSDADYAFESDENVTFINLDYNLYWTPVSNPLFAKCGAPVYANLGTFQAGEPGFNANSIEIEPIFFSATDLHRIGPNGNDQGDNAVGITTDIDNETRPAGPMVDMGADEYTPTNNDALFVDFIQPGFGACGDSMMVIEVVLGNWGSDTITSMPVTVDVTGAVTSTINYNYSGSIPYGETDTVIVGTVNTYNGGIINITGWTELVGEQFFGNDTLGPLTFTITPHDPIGYDSYGCGVDSALIFADSNYPVLYEWYDAPVGGSLVGNGTSFMVPSIATQGTYYLQYGTGTPDTLVTTYAAGNGCGSGVMFDLVSAGGSAITGFCVNSDNTPTFPLTVHYIIGSSYVGNETNAGAWTTEGSYTVTGAGTNNPSCFNILNPIVLPAGVTVAVYLEYDANYTNGTTTYFSNLGDVTLTTGAGLCSSFGGVNNGRMFNGEVQFGNVTACSNTRTPVTAIASAGVNLNLGNDSIVCGTGITLDAGASNATFDINWSTGDSTQTLLVDSSGTYYVGITDTIGCFGSDTIDIVINPHDVDLGLDFNLCAGDSAMLDAGVFPLPTYLWSTSDTTQSITIFSGGSYSVMVNDSLGCTDYDTIVVSDLNPPTASFAVGGTAFTYNFTDASTGADSVVYDFGDGYFSNNPNPSHTYAAAGSFNVCQIVYNECGTDTSCTSVTAFDDTGLDDEEELIMHLYPNPSNGEFTLSMHLTLGETYTMNVYSILGVLVYNEILPQVSGTFVHQYNLNELSAGTYMIEVKSKNHSAVKRLVIK